jgi:colanic acid/amylovoran biosynthesis glycosyltransferase
MKKVLVFAERMLPSTQTFIPLQVNELQRYRPQYVGLIPSDRNLALPHPPVMLTRDRGAISRVRRELYRWTGVAPTFHRQLRETTAGADLIHAHFAEGGPAALSLSRHLRLPLILHLRGGAELLPDHELRRHLFQLPFLAHRKRLWQRASLFLCVSNFIREKALKAGFPAEKVRVHYTGMDLKGFTITKESDHKDPNMVLYVGRLVPYKGCDYLLRAMQQVQQRRPEAHLVIIGDGTFRAQLESLARELGVRCQFLGEKPQKEIRTWYERARVFCGPSVTLEDGMSEAFGNVFSEAQAMGVPVVSFHHGGIPETMQDGITGLLAQERDVPMLAEHLLRYLEDDAFWFRSRQEGMRWVREAFDVRRQTARLEELYDDVVASFQPGRFQQKAQL